MFSYREYNGGRVPTNRFIGCVYHSIGKTLVAAWPHCNDRLEKVFGRFYFRLNPASVGDVHSGEHQKTIGF